MRARRSRATSAGISPLCTASWSADSVWDRRSVGARSSCALPTSTPVVATWSAAPASTTNLVIGGTLALRPGVEDDRHRPVVHELDLHPGAEDAGFDRHAQLAERPTERPVDLLRVVRWRSVGEARSVALRGVLWT